MKTATVQPKPRSATAQATAQAFVEIVGERLWRARIAELAGAIKQRQRGARALAQRHQVEIALERLRRAPQPTVDPAADPTNDPTTRAVASHVAELVAAYATLGAAGRARLREGLRASLRDQATPSFWLHLARTAAMQRARGFEVSYAGLAEAAPFDLLIRRQGVEAELVCDVASAEEGRDVHRGAWVRLVDRIDPDLQLWLAAHPGRYLLKLTLPQGLRAAQPCEGAMDPGQDKLAALHQRITAMLETQRRADHDEAAVLRLDPLMLAGSQADELGLVSRLRREFGHEAHLAVTAGEGGVFVMAARAGREDEVAVAIRRRLCALAPARLTGTRPGILAVLVEDTDRMEWQHLRERLAIEGEARQFLTCPEARCVVAVTCTSRFELLGESGPAVAPEGELRFRSPGHPNARSPGLAPAIISAS